MAMQYSDQMIYESLHTAGVVRSQYEFSRMCGRCVSWFSSSRCQQREMSAGALANLSISLEAKAMQQRSWREAQHLRDLAKRIRQELWHRSVQQLTSR